MKTIGIIGGMGPEATLDYYKEIINAFKQQSSKLAYPQIIIYSINMADFLYFMKRKDYTKATEFLLSKIDALKKAGADFVAISANTPHLLFENIRKGSSLPLISIVEATCKVAVSAGYKRAGLLGTGFTMNADFYARVFNEQDIEIIVPGKQDIDLINTLLFTEIELGIFKEETRLKLIEIIEKMKTEQQIDSIILGCTEFPLILSEAAYAGLPVLNTTLIHVNEIVEYAKAPDETDTNTMQS